MSLPIARRQRVAIRLVFASFAFLLGSVAASSAATEEFDLYAARGELADAHADVFRLYWAFFDREPDVGGAKYWVEQYDRCTSLLDITWSFSNSEEFKRRYGNLDDGQYVDLVYASVLDRAPDAEGRAYWLAELKAGKLIQSEVMLYFSLSSEFKQRHRLPSDGRPYGGCVAPAAPVTTTTAVPETTAVPLSVAPAIAQSYYANCTEARSKGAAPIRIGDPGYRRGLDRDGDGIGCE